MNRISVMPAGQDRRVPVEGQKGVYFAHGEVREVYHTRYIQQRIDDGDLVITPAPAAAPVAEQHEGVV